MATQVRIIDDSGIRPSSMLSKNLIEPWLAPNSKTVAPKPAQNDSHNLHTQTQTQPFDLSAHSVQFVASPGQTCRLKSALPVMIRETLYSVPGFAGCMVMVSDQEARLVTVVTLWTGKERARHCSENVDRVRKLLSRYVDRWLRSENHVAHFSLFSPLGHKLPEGSLSENLPAQRP